MNITQVTNKKNDTIQKNTIAQHIDNYALQTKTNFINENHCNIPNIFAVFVTIF